MALDKRLSRFYPNLASRILLYLRSIQKKREFVYPQELIEHYQISKSFLSQKLKLLKKYGLVNTKIEKKIIRSAHYLKIFITKRGLSTALEILSEGLNSNELRIVNKRSLKK